MRKRDYPPTPLGYLVIAVVFLVGLLHLVGAWQEWQVREYLCQHGTLTEAAIVERSDVPRDFYVKYSFTPSGKGVAMTRRENTSVFYSSIYLKHADKVSILYDPADAKISRITDNNSFIVGGVVGVAGTVLTIYSAVILTKALLKLRKETH